MAIWQFQCNIIPLRGNINALNFDEIISWQNNITFLERKKSWSENIIQYGNIDETCIEFIYGKGALEEINCRLDLRTLSKENLIQILEYIQNIGACFIVENKIYSPDLEKIIPVIKQSKAYQYCKNPLEYIKNCQ